MKNLVIDEAQLLREEAAALLALSKKRRRAIREANTEAGEPLDPMVTQENAAEMQSSSLRPA